MSADDLELAFDAEAAEIHVRERDPALAAIIDRVGPLRLRRRYPTDPFMALLRAIVYQQLSGHAAGAIFARVCERLGDEDVPAALLACDDADLRAAGLSRPKIAAARDLAAHACDGRLPGSAALASMGDDEIVERLTDIRGIGRWTVEMLLIFGLGRPDVLPVNDLGVRKGFARVHGGDLPAPAELARFGERWRPYRSVASWYLWRATELPA